MSICAVERGLIPLPPDRQRELGEPISFYFGFASYSGEITAAVAFDDTRPVVEHVRVGPSEDLAGFILQNSTVTENYLFSNNLLHRD